MDTKQIAFPNDQLLPHPFSTKFNFDEMVHKCEKWCTHPNINFFIVGLLGCMAMLGRKRVQKILIFHYKGPTIFIPIWTIWKKSKRVICNILNTWAWNIMWFMYVLSVQQHMSLLLLSKLIGFVILVPIWLPIFI